jgi:hypothetical protein
MDVTEAVDRLRRAHADAGLGQLARPGAEAEAALAQIVDAVAPWRLPADLLSLWRSIDPDSLAVAPCPRPAGPALALRLWRSHLSPDWGLESYFPWCYESHDFMLVELDEPDHARGDCFRWAGGSGPVVRAFASVAAYVDLLATMVELREFVHHTELGVIEFDPGRRWPDAQAVRLAAGQQPQADQLLPTELTTVAQLLARAESGESPSGAIRARVVGLSGSASGQRIEVTDGTGRLDVWCPASLCAGGPLIDRMFEFRVTVQPGCQQLSDCGDALTGIERATRRGDIEAAVALATPLYDELFGTPAKAQAIAIHPLP